MHSADMKEMQSEKKKKKAVDYIVKRLHNIIFNSIRKGDYETALEAVAACVEISCNWNQSYVDEYSENSLNHITKNVLKTSIKKEDIDEKTILFYDGVGYDTRGLMLNYIEALLALEYRIIYVTIASARGKQPTLVKIAEGKDFIWEYLSVSLKYIPLMQELNELFIKYRPAKAFLYILTYDILGPAVFSNYRGVVERFLIRLGDHMYSFDGNAVDYYLEFRDFGANVSRLYRGIEKEKIIKIPFYPYIDYSMKFEGFPFDEDGHKVIFSGGVLSKTFDAENTYYKLVKSILEYDAKTVFLYAGAGDDSELKRLMVEFPRRVWHIPERKDLYQLMKHVYFYLSTYPMAGGLMTQYAAIAGKVPVTIENKSGLDEILSNQENCKYLFDNVKEALQEIYKLLDCEEYAEQKGQDLKHKVIGKKDFENAVKLAVMEHTGFYKIKEQEVEVDNFMCQSLYLFDFNSLKKIVIKDKHWELRKYFPILFLRKRLRNLKNLLKHIFIKNGR